MILESASRDTRMPVTTLPYERRKSRAFSSRCTCRADALRALQAVARRAISREVRMAHGSAASGARAFRGDAPLQCSVWLLRLLENRSGDTQLGAEELC